MRAAVCPVALALVAVTSMAQEAPPPPYETSLGPGPVRLELDVAELDVVVGYSPDSLLRGWAADGGSQAGELLAVRAGGGGARVTRREPADPAIEVELPKLRLELELASGQRLAIRGTELTVRLTTAPLPHDLDRSPVPVPDVAPEPVRDGAAPPPVDASAAAALANPVELVLTRSSAVLEAITGPAVVAEGSDVRLSGCLGASSLRLTGGVSAIEDHHGPLTVTGRGAELTVVRGEGEITATLAGGSLLARDGLGLITAQLEDGLLQVEGWSGALSLAGAGTAEVRHSAGATLTAVGRQLSILADGWSGLVKAELDGGEIRGGDWSARADLLLKGGATAEVDGVRNNVVLKAEAGCAADLRDIGGKLEATLNGARLNARGVGSLSLHAVDAEVTVTEVSRLDRADAARSTLDLDLTGARQRTVVGLNRDTTATIRVSTPCHVRTLGPGSTLGNQARVTGCEHRVGSQRWMTSSGRGLDGQQPVELVVTLAESASVDVDGVP